MSSMSSLGTSASDANIIVYNYPLSPCGEKVRFALTEKGLRWTDIHIDLGAKENLSPDYLRINPKGLVPVLIHGADVVAESTIILEYIDDMWPEKPLRPRDPGARARMRKWLKLVDETLHPAWPGIAWPILVRPVWQRATGAEVERMLAALIDPARRERQARLYRFGLDSEDARVSIDVLRDVCRLAEEALAASDWVAGEEFSLADLALLPYIFVLDTFDPRLVRTARFPNMQAWYARACIRQAFGGDLGKLFSPDRLAEVRALARVAGVGDKVLLHMA